MNEVLTVLESFKDELNHRYWDIQTVNLAIGKLNLYVKKFFSQNSSYQDEISDINRNPESQEELNASTSKILALVDVLIADVRVNDEFKVLKIEEYNELVKETERKEKMLFLVSESNEELKRKNQSQLEQIQQLSEARASDLEREKILSKEANLFASDVSSLAATNNELNQEIAQFKEEIASANEKNILLISAHDKLVAETLELKEYKQKNEIARNSFKFKEQAYDNKVASRYWMGAVVLSLISFMYVLYLGFIGNDELYGIAKHIQGDAKNVNSELLNKLIYIEIGKKLVSKALIYSMIIYLISFLVKNYNAHMHNYIVNSHKSNALSSTVDLIGTAKSSDGNDKILEQATQAIFTAQKSGYSGSENEPASPNLITNVIDAVKSKAS